MEAMEPSRASPATARPPTARSEAADRADFSGIRYAQCWEDADVLLEALDVQPGDVCLSIASAGDNTLSLLARRPERVLAVDLSPAQLACLELRVAAYRVLSHAELLELIGSVASRRRTALYLRCRRALAPAARAFWDGRGADIAQGIGAAGKFERYFALFRERVLPLIHTRGRIRRLLRGGAYPRRRAYYDRHWDNWRWRLLFRLFFSRPVMGRFGRDPSFFKYVEGGIGSLLMERTRHAVTVLDPAANPYLQWILTGRHPAALPFALRPENFETIRAHLDRLELHCQPVEELLASRPRESIDRYNLSDVFEYLSPENTSRLLERAAHCGRRGGRLVYWNTFVPRSRPERLAERLRPLTELAERLHQQDKAFFYRRLVIEEIA
jgi:S-adenosylmethionine-diacylglycerol 3-amino-3-carboxypropyl transferase